MPPPRLRPPRLAGGSPIDVQVMHSHALLAAGIRATLASHARIDAADADRPPSHDGGSVLVTDLAQALQLRSDAAPGPASGCVLVVEGGLTAHKVKALLHSGVQGCVSADGGASELLLAVQALGSGGTYFCPLTSGLLADALGHPELTERELRVLELLCEGLDNKSIAGRMQIAPGTVKCHVKSILAKTATRTRTAVAAQAIREGWVKPTR